MRRAFWLASAVIFLDEAVFVAILPLLPEYAERFGLSAAEVGLMVAAYPLLMLVSSLPGGLMTDRLGARTLLVGGTALLVLATLGFAYAQNGWQLAGARALQGLASGVTSIAGMALVTARAGSGRRATAIGIAVSLQGLSVLAGPAIGGFAAPMLGIETAFLIPAAFGVFVIACLLLPGWVEPAPAASAIRIRASIVGAVRSPAVRGAVAMIFAVGFVGGVVQTLAPLRLDRDGYSTSDLGWLFLAAAVVSLAATPLAGRFADATGVGRVATVWTLAVVALVVALIPDTGAWPTVAVLLVLLPLFRVGGALGYALGAEYAALGAGLAAGFGLVLTGWSLGAVAGPPIAGAVGDAFGDAAAFAIAAAVALVLAIPVAASRRDLAAQRDLAPVDPEAL
jgi:predicted MFS family arabinose efflux permease